MALNVAITRVSTYQILQIFLGVSLLTICAQIKIPLHPVPITMQTVAVLFIGLFYNKINAPLTILIYLGLGTIGLPVFANYSFGINAVIGPTVGYRIGFLVAVCIMSFYKGTFLKKNIIIQQFCLCLMGNIVIMGLGYLWLAKLFGMREAFEVGVYPFIIPGIVKSLLLIGLIQIVKPSQYIK